MVDVICSIRDLMRVLDSLPRAMAPRGWLYRGLHDARFQLQPSVGRLGATRSGGRHDRGAEHRILEEFKRRALTYAGIVPDNDLEWLILGQQYGLPTRLLDWTESPLVAAFFATEVLESEAAAATCSRPSPGAPDAAIIAVPRPPSMPASAWHHPLDVKRTEAVRPRHLTRRVAWQQALFTVHHQPTSVWRPRALRKWIVPAARRDALMAQLWELGLTRSLLFPDLDGVGRDLAWQFRTGALR